MRTEYNIVLKEKPLDDGLTKSEVMDMYDMLSGPRAVLVEFQGEYSVAAGLINLTDADFMDYDYSNLEAFIVNILNNMSNESPDCEYIFRSKHCDHTIWLSR